MKKFLFLLFLIFISLHSRSNVESKIKIDLDFYNRHYWRGFQLGSAPAIKPNITFSNQGFNFSIWAARTINSSYSEIDLIPSYKWRNYTFTLFNYYNPIAGKENNYFIFSGKDNRHSVELAMNYDGMGKIPVKLMAGTFIYGDKNPETENPFFSTYFEFGYPFVLKNIEGEIHFGFSPFKGYYTEKAAIVSTGLTLNSRIGITEELHLPLKLSFHMNPYTSNAFIIFAFGIRKI